MKHKQIIKGDYVFTPCQNAFNTHTSYWLSKEGYTVALYCFTPIDSKDLKECLEDKTLEAYIERFRREVEKEPKSIVPEITGITLLAAEEARALPGDIRSIGKSWWLRSPGYYDYYAEFVYSDGLVCQIGDFVHFEHGVRPALVFNPESSNLSEGDHFEAAGHTWTVIAKNKALCDGIIGKCAFRANYRTVNANNFETSDIKKFLDKWFEQKFKEVA